MPLVLRVEECRREQDRRLREGLAVYSRAKAENGGQVRVTECAEHIVRMVQSRAAPGKLAVPA